MRVWSYQTSETLPGATIKESDAIFGGTTAARRKRTPALASIARAKGTLTFGLAYRLTKRLAATYNVAGNIIGLLYRKAAGIRGFSEKKRLLSRLALPSRVPQIPGAALGAVGEAGEFGGKRGF